MDNAERTEAVRAERLLQVADRLMDKLGRVIEALPDQKTDAQTLKAIVSCLKELRDMQQYRAPGAYPEQDGADDGGIVVRLAGELEDYSG